MATAEEKAFRRIKELEGFWMGEENREAVTVLKLQSTEVTDEDLELFAIFPNVDELDLFDTKITGEGLKHVKHWKELDTLYLTSCKNLTDECLKHVGEMSGLWTLTLDLTTITDDGLRHLQGLTELRVLNITETECTGEGLKYLEGMTNLNSLYAKYTYISLEEAEELKEKLPNLENLG